MLAVPNGGSDGDVPPPVTGDALMTEAEAGSSHRCRLPSVKACDLGPCISPAWGRGKVLHLNSNQRCKFPEAVNSSERTLVIHRCSQAPPYMA